MSERIIVMVADEHMAKIKALAGELGAAGMQVEQVLPTAGLITGHVAEHLRATIDQVPGVARVEDLFDYQLPPRDLDLH
jgi:hypothetical protein